MGHSDSKHSVLDSKALDVFGEESKIYCVRDTDTVSTMLTVGAVVSSVVRTMGIKFLVWFRNAISVKFQLLQCSPLSTT